MQTIDTIHVDEVEIGDLIKLPPDEDGVEDIIDVTDVFDFGHSLTLGGYSHVSGESVSTSLGATDFVDVLGA